MRVNALSKSLINSSNTGEHVTHIAQIPRSSSQKNISEKEDWSIMNCYCRKCHVLATIGSSRPSGSEEKYAIRTINRNSICYKNVDACPPSLPFPRTVLTESILRPPFLSSVVAMENNKLQVVFKSDNYLRTFNFENKS